VVHLEPLQWINDWPVIGSDPDGDGKGEPVLTHKMPLLDRRNLRLTPQTSDEFTAEPLGLQWQWQANYQQQWFSLVARPHWLRLFAEHVPERAANLWPVPNLLLQKLPAEEFTVTTKVEFAHLERGEKTGSIMFGSDYSFIAVERTEAGFRLIKSSCKNAIGGGKEILENQTKLLNSTVLLRVSVSSGAACQFSFSRDGGPFLPAGEAFMAHEGRWVGAKVGLFTLARSRAAGGRGFADFDWFRLNRYTAE
jgi:beta-xylosidase